MERDRSAAHVRMVLAEAGGLAASVRSLHDEPEGLWARARSALADAKAEEVATQHRNTPVASLKQTAGREVRFDALEAARLTTVDAVLRAGRTGL